MFASFMVAGQLPIAINEARPFPPVVSEVFVSFDRNQRSGALALADSMYKAWDNGRFSESQKDTIAGVIERLFGGRFQSWPDPANYFRIILHISQQTDANRLFARWHQALAHSLQTQTPTRTAEFLERSRKLFLENILFRSGAVTWKVRNNSPKFDFVNNNESIVSFSASDLICLTQTDSSVIYNTSALVSLDRNYLLGQGGRVTWQRALLDQTKVFAELNRYEIDLAKAAYQADSVTFYHLDFFEKPLPGRITERIVAEFKPEDANFPVFESQQQKHTILNVYPGINYHGGFVLQGAKVLGAGIPGEPARIEKFRNGEKVIALRSGKFVIRPDRLLSDRASFTMYLDRDSIYHPNLTVRYLNQQREFLAMRDERGNSRAPFFNTYHRIDMYCEAIYWNLDSAFMTFQMIRGVGQPQVAIFESHDFFSQARYNLAQGIDDVNPLLRLSSFARNNGTQEFYLFEYSQFLGREPSSVKQDLLNLSFQGFILYDHTDDRIIITERLYHYLAANARKADYDVMQIRSVAPVNARFEFETRNLDLGGVERILLSSAKNVVIYPNDGKITLGVNRNLAFDGRVESGMFDFFGKDFFFEYEQFKITINNSDSLSFRVRSFKPDSRGLYEKVKVKNVLETINGELLVDHPANKSGRLGYSHYPVFSSFSESYVYYDSDQLHNGAYERENTFFRIKPFTIDSLDKATPENIYFGGVFVSKGIFPEFEDFITVQHDYTLGFSTTTPAGGAAVYNGLATYSGPLSMSSKGLVATGRMEFLGSVIDADSLLMLPNQAKGSARSFNLAADSQAGFPAIQANDVNFSLTPAENTMRISNTNEAFAIYDGRAAFKGDVELTPQKLSGSGRIEIQQAGIHAGDFLFNQNSLVSQKSDMEVVAQTGKQAFVHRDFSARIDVENLTGTFSPTNANASINFPTINLLAQGYEYDWDLEKGLIEMRSASKGKLPAYGELLPELLVDINFSGHEMIFTGTTKDSLRFFAPNVNLDLKNYNLKAEGVPLIRVADAAIFPEKGILNVDSSGAIQRLSNAHIIASITNRYHTFFNANVEITSSKQYRASGYYHFTDNNQKTREVFFEKIGVDNQLKTFAEATLPDSHGFFLSSQFAFFGKALIKADQQFLNFEGYSKIEIPCSRPATGWFSFNAPIDPAEITIPVVQGMRNPYRQEVFAAVMLAADSMHVYPAIFAKPQHYLDHKLVSAYGYLVYDDHTGEYLISTPEKIKNRGLHHNLLRISTRECVVIGEGKIDLGVDLGQFKMENYGTLAYNPKTNVTDLDIVMGLNFSIANRIMGAFLENADLVENPRFNLNSQKFRTFLASKTNPEIASVIITDYLSNGSIGQMPKEIVQTITLGDVNLRWNQPSRSFVSYGPIGLFSMGQNQVVRNLKGNMEVRKLRAGDTFTLLFRASDASDAGIGRNWYFFNMNNNMLTVLSSVSEFNEAVRRIRPGQRQMKTPTGEPPFFYDLAQERRPYDFFHVMRQIKIN